MSNHGDLWKTRSSTCWVVGGRGCIRVFRLDPVALAIAKQSSPAAYAWIEIGCCGVEGVHAVGWYAGHLRSCKGLLEHRRLNNEQAWLGQVEVVPELVWRKGRVEAGEDGTSANDAKV